MAIKEQLDTTDFDTDFLDIPLFATVDEAVQDIQIGNSQVKIQMTIQEDE